MNVHSAVRTLRDELRLSQQAFATKLGLSVRTIANYEKDRVPHPAHLAALASVAREIDNPTLAEVFDDVLAAQINVRLIPAEARWPEKYRSLDITSEREWVYMACARELARTYLFAFLWKPFLKLMTPMIHRLIKRGDLDDDARGRLIREAADFERIQDELRKAGSKVYKDLLKP